MLGYVISLVPDRFNRLFGFSGRTHSVSIEAYHEQDRSDILIETANEQGALLIPDPVKDCLRSMDRPLDWGRVR